MVSALHITFSLTLLATCIISNQPNSNCPQPTSYNITLLYTARAVAPALGNTITLLKLLEFTVWQFLADNHFYTNARLRVAEDRQTKLITLSQPWLGSLTFISYNRPPSLLWWLYDGYFHSVRFPSWNSVSRVSLGHFPHSKPPRFSLPSLHPWCSLSLGAI